MNIDATVNFENGSRLFMLSEFFNKELDAEIFKLFINFKDNPDWKAVDEFRHNNGRLVYRGNDPVVNDIRECGKQYESELSSLLGKNIIFEDFAMWTDNPGYKIPPHYDTAPFEHAVQIYMTDPLRNFEMLGTAFYKANKQYLFEMPYRRNAGYFIDSTHSIMHGLHHHIPPEYYRYSIYLKYKKADQ